MKQKQQARWGFAISRGTMPIDIPKDYRHKSYKSLEYCQKMGREALGSAPRPPNWSKMSEREQAGVKFMTRLSIFPIKA